MIKFLQPPSVMNYIQYCNFLEKFNKWKYDDILFFTFYIMDINEDFLLC